MNDETLREITDEMLLSDLTVGEFKELVQSLLQTMLVVPSASAETETDPKIDAPVTVRRKSLDEFMSDLNK